MDDIPFALIIVLGNIDMWSHSFLNFNKSHTFEQMPMAYLRLYPTFKYGEYDRQLIHFGRQYHLLFYVTSPSQSRGVLGFKGQLIITVLIVMRRNYRSRAE
jgi:hypothetical protein